MRTPEDAFNSMNFSDTQCVTIVEVTKKMVDLTKTAVLMMKIII